MSFVIRAANEGDLQALYEMAKLRRWLPTAPGKDGDAFKLQA